MSNSIALTYRDKVFLNGLALNLTEMSEFNIGPWLSCCLWPASDKTDIELTSAELVLMRNDVSDPEADVEAATAFDRQDASIFPDPDVSTFCLHFTFFSFCAQKKIGTLI